MTLPRSPRPNYTDPSFPSPSSLSLSLFLSIFLSLPLSLSPVSLSSYMALIIIKQLP